MRILYGLLIVVMSMMSSCRPEGYLTMVQKELADVEGFDYKDYSFLVIIPDAGCTGCISEAVNFFLHNQDDRIFFIFTNVFSMKDFRLRMGEGIQNKKNIYVDTDNDFLCEDENVNAYPIVIDVREKANLSWTYLNPGEDIETMFDRYK
ncbi:MAG TPA: hypothetical protein H9922_07430 [Candidatus Phocaeicola caecigallinarum]|nr:hypothetical protein [Candidatus Phocaeicola caecigallinarum]